ncbi:hypothetical protein XELAEV_18043743mg [Xenopus laevis]|uniref:Uncharacterized protein n=1 Tax=Xenopus laevis TaxID=8355 RepID=A0A974H2P0_XENLA|nr:hypothetical protein XELAEV_18043743mg [Xenopus laevis]
MFNDEEFMERWESILNKCSFDLELALMERIQKEMPDSAHKKMALEQKVRNLETPEKFETGKKKLQDVLRHFQEETEMRKRQKFYRDSADYESGNVYRKAQSANPGFRKGAYGRRSRYRRDWRKPGNSPRESDSDSSATSSASVDFLGGSQSTMAPGAEGGAVGNIGERRQIRPQRTKKKTMNWW